jgi:hypothetical protein
MQTLGEKLSMPVRNTKLYPFGEPAPVPAATAEGAKEGEDAAAEEEKKTAGMLEEVQVSAVVSVLLLRGGLRSLSYQRYERLVMSCFWLSPQTSPIKVDDADNVAAADSASTPHCGPIEGKVLRGSDGRDYVLEVMRLTPRDASYILGDKGTGKVPLLDQADKDIAVTYILRRELIDIYMQNKLNAQRQKVMKEASEKLIEVVAALMALGVESAPKLKYTALFFK